MFEEFVGEKDDQTAIFKPHAAVQNSLTSRNKRQGKKTLSSGTVSHLVCGFMKKLKQNASGAGFGFLPPWQAEGSGSNVVFGNDGLLSARVRSLVAVFGKKVVLEMESSTYKSHADEWNAKASIGIGPFKFSANGGQSHFTEHTTGNRTTLTIEDTSTDPQIIGVNLSFPGLE